MPPQSLSIRDPVTGSSAEILTSQGFNCFRFTAMPGGTGVSPVIAGQPLDVLYAPPDFATGESRPSRGGIPLLFPFPGRIPGTKLTWKRKKYTLEAGDALGNAIHGFVMWRPWRIIDQADNQLSGEFHAWRDDPSLKERWPADFKLTAIYTLLGNTLHAHYTIENPGDAPLPCGFGTHPYFRVPLGSKKADNCIVRLPVSARWELKDMLPTGKQIKMRGAEKYQAGQRYGDLKLDDVFTGLQFSGDWCESSIHDSASGRTITQRFDGAFRECVVYTPPHREAICIEPLTCAPNSFELTREKIDAGLRVLEPGESFTARVEITAS
jgi:aldose 1-epimerase